MLENIELFGNSLGVDNESVLQNIFDVIHPVGEIYVQYPQQSSPIELYNNSKIKSVWEEQLQYDSAFFRANKGTGDGTYIYKVSNETQYYAADINGNPTIPVKAIADNGGTITLSQEGASKIYDGKTYLSYKINGANNSAASYINETNGLSKQGNCNKSHNHTTNGAKADLSIDSGGNSFSCRFRGSAENSSSTNRSIVFAVSGCSVSKGGDTGAAIDNLDSGSWDLWTFSYSGSHGHGITQNNHSHGITQNNHTHSVNSDGESESRPDNYTIRIWKRIN